MQDETYLITDDYFGPDTAQPPYQTPAAAPAPAIAIADAQDLAQIAPHLAQITHLRIACPRFLDGRALTLGQRARALGFGGRMRIFGDVLPDQYAMARRAGFDEVEIPAPAATRHKAAHWQARADWRAHHYQARLRG